MKPITHGLSKIFLALFIFVNLWGAPAFAAPESKTVAEARELVDTYYGSQSNLRRSAELLEQAYEANPEDAHVFVQAARITVMGGHLKFGKYETGTFERYGALLDKAIALDPSNAKAHILKAEVFQHQKRYDLQLAELNKAKALGTSDPWLLIGFAAYYRNIRNYRLAYETFAEVERLGPGSTASERKAYVGAMRGLRTYVAGTNETFQEKLKRYAAIALKERYPTDAWTPLAYAEDFLDYDVFDEAIVYAREALKTMDFGAGRVTLAASLYAKAAHLIITGRPQKEARPLIAEAETYGYSKATILEYLLERRGVGGNLKVLAPTLEKIIR